MFQKTKKIYLTFLFLFPFIAGANSYPSSAETIIGCFDFYSGCNNTFQRTDGQNFTILHINYQIGTFFGNILPLTQSLVITCDAGLGSFYGDVLRAGDVGSGQVDLSGYQSFTNLGVPVGGYDYCDVIFPLDSNYTPLDGLFSIVTIPYSEATSSPPLLNGSGTTTINNLYNGVNYHDWLFVACTFLFFLAIISWRIIFKPLKTLFYDN